MRLATVLILISALVNMAGCGGESNVEAGNRDGILHVGNSDEPQALDPHIVTGLPEYNILSALLEGLVVKNPRTLEPEPGVAEAWEISADGRVYTFHLRKDARWSNGDPVTAEDFAWSWWRALQPALGNQYAYMYHLIENAEAYASGDIDDFGQVGIQVLDRHRLRVTLENPAPYFLQLLDHFSMYPVHRATLEAFGPPEERNSRWTRPGSFVGNGPFVLREWHINRIIEVEKNRHYWDAGKVALNGIHFHPVQNTTTEERMFRAGQLHITGTIPVDKIAHYRRNHPELIQVAPYLGTYFYRFNTRVAPLDDKRVRLALSYAVDRRQLVDHITKGGELPAHSFTPPDTDGYTADGDLAFDPDKARRLLAEAGYPDGEGFPTTEVLYNTAEGHRKVAVALQQMWNRHLNIQVTLTNQDWKVYLDSVDRGDYSIARAGWIGDYLDPNTFLDMWVTGGGNNRTGWSNADYDELVLRRAPGAQDRESRYRLLRKAEAILLHEMPVMPLYIYTSKSLVQPAVEGLEPNILDYTLYKALSLGDEKAVLE